MPPLSALVAGSQRRARLEEQLVETRALRRSDDLKTALLRSVSHDLRTPLTAIRTAASVLGAEELSRGSRVEMSEVIAEEADRLGRLVDNLLDLSRLQAGTAAPRVDWCSVAELIDSAASGLRAQGQRFDVELDTELPLVRADAAQLERALGNLLENAARYGGEAPVTVRARVQDRRLILRVSDSGPGIEAHELKRIFEPFYRAPGAPPGGSGLGLAIAKGFVEANGGRLRAESLPGQGATFVVDLPLERSAASPVVT